MFVRSLPLLFSNICFRSGPLFPTFLYLNPVSSSIQPNLIISYCISSHLSHFIFVSRSPLTYIHLIPTPDFCPTSVRLLSDSGIQRPFRNYRTYPHIIRVGATHKLKPSPTCYPLSIIPLTQLQSNSNPVLVPSWNRPLTIDSN